MKRDSPEERLLRLIKSGARAPVLPPPGAATEARAGSSGGPGLAAPAGGTRPARPRPVAPPPRQEGRGIRGRLSILNRVLAVLLMGIVGYAIVTAAQVMTAPPVAGVGEPEVIPSPGPAGDGPAPAEAPLLKPYDEYAAHIGQRELFSPLVLETAAPLVPGVTIGQLVEHLSLVGILAGDEPQAMIQDTSQQKTYILKQGETVGDLEVYQILQDQSRVILRYGTEETELVL